MKETIKAAILNKTTSTKLKRNRSVLKTAALIMAAVLVLSGCGSGPAISNQYLEISEYKNLEITKVVAVEVTDEDVDAEIQSRISAHNTLTEVIDRGVEPGDTVVVDCAGLINGVAMDNLTVESKKIYIGEEVFVPGFDEKLLSHNRGEQFEFDLVLPDPYLQDMSKSGATVHWIVTITAIYTGDMPELTDSLVKESLKIPGVNTVEQYRSYVRNKLETKAESDAKYAREQEVWEAVYANTILKAYPEGEVEAYVNETTEAYEKYAGEERMTFDEYMEHLGMTTSEFTEEITKAARNAVIQKLILSAIAENENLDVEFKDYENYLETFAVENGYESAEELEELYEPEEIRNAMMQERVLEYLVDESIETGIYKENRPFAVVLIVMCAVCVVLLLVIIFILLRHRSKSQAAAQPVAPSNESKLDANGYHTELEVPDPEDGISIGDTQIIQSSADYEVNSYDPAVESDPMLEQNK